MISFSFENNHRKLIFKENQFDDPARHVTKKMENMEREKLSPVKNLFGEQVCVCVCVCVSVCQRE